MAMGRSGRQVVHAQGEARAWQRDRRVHACVPVVLRRYAVLTERLGVCAKPPGICDCFSDCRNCIVACIPGLNFFSLGQVLCRPVPSLRCASAHSEDKKLIRAHPYARDTCVCASPHAARRSMAVLLRH